LKYWNKKSCAGLALTAALLWVLPAQLSADTTTQNKTTSTATRKSRKLAKHATHKAAAGAGQPQSAQHQPATRQVSSQAKPAGTPATHQVSSKTKLAGTPAKRHLSARARRAAEARRRARMRPAPERIEEIQQALAQAGYLKAQPNGRWDDQTREAMRRYQADHGFPATGLPEAKSLMKLGLGPHPLPAELDPSSGAKAGTDTISSTRATPSARQDPP
jgi:hypothetical protein